MPAERTASMAGPERVEVRLAARLAAAPEVLFALLFGSRAGGRPQTDSDWDVAVYLAEELTPRERFDTRLRLASDLAEVASPLELVVLNDAPALLGHRALMGQRLLVRDKTAYVRYFVRTLAASEDERYWRDLHHRERLKRLEEGRFGRP